MSERNQEIEREYENPQLLYVLTHTFKHLIFTTEGLNWETGSNERYTIQENATNALWTLRDHPHYLAYAEADEGKLSDFLGILPNDPKIIGVLKHSKDENMDEYLYSYSRMSLCAESTKDLIIKIPEMDDPVQRSLLTDIIAASGRNILEVMEKPYHQERNLIQANRAGISLAEYQDFRVAILNYSLFIVGYVFPYMSSCRRTVAFIEKQKIGRTLDHPLDFIRENFGLNI